MHTEECRIEDYLTPVTDDFGKSFSIYFRIPPVVRKAVNCLFDSGNFPFQAKVDLYRWAFYRGVKSLEEMKCFKREIPLLHLVLTLYHARWPLEDLGFSINLDIIVMQLEALGYTRRRIGKLLVAIEDVIKCMPSERERRSHLREFNRRWSSLIAQATGAAKSAGLVKRK